MIITQTEPSLAVTSSESTIFEVIDAGTLDLQFVLTNIGSTLGTPVNSTITYKFQYSADRASWTDVAANATIADTASVVLTLARPETYLRLRASVVGSTNSLSATVTRQNSFSTTFVLGQA